MNAGYDLLKLIKETITNSINYMQLTDVLFGTVISVDPLTVETDQKLVFTHEFLVLSRNVTDYQTWISFDNPSIKQKIQIWDKAEKESQSEPLPVAIEAGSEPHQTRLDDIPPPEKSQVTDIQFLKKWYDNTLGIEDENREIPEKIELPAFHEVTIYNHLRVGERVMMVKEKGGQRYFIIDREGLMTAKERGI